MKGSLFASRIFHSFRNVERLMHSSFSIAIVATTLTATCSVLNSSTTEQTYNRGLMATSSSSLSAYSDGYAWNAASSSDKMKLCRQFAQISTHHCSANYFYDAFNEFYNTTDDGNLSQSIIQMAALFEEASKSLPEDGRNY